MKYTAVKNPTWSVDKTSIDCLVTFEGLGEVSFAANPNDVYEHGREIYTRCMAGEFGPIAEHTPIVAVTLDAPAIPVSTPGAIL